MTRLGAIWRIVGDWAIVNACVDTVGRVPQRRDIQLGDVLDMDHGPPVFDPVWPSAITRALAIEAVFFFVAYAGVWWAVGAGSEIPARKAVLLGLGAIALGIESSAMATIR